MKHNYLPIRPFSCSCDEGNHWTTIYAGSHSKARYKYYLHLDCDEPYSEVFKYIKVKVCGRAMIPENFTNMIKYRNIEFAYLGMKVFVKGCGNGILTGSNPSANMTITMTDGKYKGQDLNVHPQSDGCIFYSKTGKIIHENKI